MKQKFNWNFTKCRAKYKGHREANYTFYIVDYVYGEFPEPKLHITGMRNKGLVKTAYFMSEGKARMFINLEGGRLKLGEYVDELFVKNIRRCLPTMIDNMFKGNKKKGVDRM